VNPSRREPLPDRYPICDWETVERMVEAAYDAFCRVLGWPGDRFADFLDRYAERIEGRAAELVEKAHLETGLPAEPRLKDIELPRTTNQLRQAAAAAREGSWALPTIDSKLNIRSIYGPIGPVVVFGPNNFPFAFNAISGGDFAAAVAAGNPVIAKAHPSHAGTCLIFAEEANEAAKETDMPPGFVQMLYRLSHEDGCRLVAHPKIGATGYTGSRSAGLRLKAAADRAGKPIYLELSSINPVIILPGALAERLEEVADQFADSCLLGTGQFCTNPGLVILLAGEHSEALVAAVKRRFEERPPGVLLNEGVERNFRAALEVLLKAGAELVTGGRPAGHGGYGFQNTLLKVDGKRFLERTEELQTEVFGNCSLFVLAADEDELLRIVTVLEGNLTGSIYSDTNGNDDALYGRIALLLRQRVGRLLNDKMPTGVAVTAAMNHGGPYPATGHPGFTAVGIPAAIRRFASLQCYDNVRQHRLPPLLRDRNPEGRAWRYVDGEWTKADVGGR